MVKVGSLMWWLHEVEIHLAIGAFSAGAAFGLFFGMIIWWINRRGE